MDKTQLRRYIREQKRAMSEEEIVQRSARLAQMFAATPAYQAAKTIYGYLSYNQEVRTMPILEQALRDGKRVAVPKVYGEEMRFLYLDDLSLVAKGYGGIPEPIADEPVADDKTALVLMPGLDTAGASMINFWPQSRITPLWRCATTFKFCPPWKLTRMIFPWTRFSGPEMAKNCFAALQERNNGTDWDFTGCRPGSGAVLSD